MTLYAHLIIILEGPDPKELCKHVQASGGYRLLEQGKIDTDREYYYLSQYGMADNLVSLIVEFHDEPRTTLYHNIRGGIEELQRKFEEFVAQGITITEQIAGRWWGDTTFETTEFGFRNVYSVPTPLSRVRFRSAQERDELAQLVEQAQQDLARPELDDPVMNALVSSAYIPSYSNIIENVFISEKGLTMGEIQIIFQVALFTKTGTGMDEVIAKGQVVNIVNDLMNSGVFEHADEGRFVMTNKARQFWEERQRRELS